ncbi:uncharacterized protein VTP21DRAFT_1889 [Calcarisporiella thermophila]|uniref:uncharacterized protein n=1 Tax=Calcarisporiella thermophila TaxID=911321 RepID=UPI003743D11B
MAPLQVIGAGLGRTGTLSLMSALEELGFGPCYHRMRVKRSHYDVFVNAFKGKKVDWDQVFDEYSSTVDWPSAAFYQQLMIKYPEAKIVLTVRDSSEKWSESMLKTISILLPRYDSIIEQILFLLSEGYERWIYTRYFDKCVFDGRLRDKNYLIAVYERHCEEVKRVVPTEKLLIFNVKEGWEPLCKFLGVDIPSSPFPTKNDSGEFENIFSKPVERRKRIVKWSLLSVLVATVSIAMLLKRKNFF